MKGKAMGMGKAALVVSAGVMLSRVLGLGRETMLAALIGVNAVGDVYRAAFLIQLSVGRRLFDHHLRSYCGRPAPKG